MEDVYISVTFVYDLSHLKLTERVMSGRKKRNVFKNPLKKKLHWCFVGSWLKLYICENLAIQ